LVIGDRKFADIASTVRKQLKQHPAAHMPNKMDACTIHTIAGAGAIAELTRNEIDALLVAEMSNDGNNVLYETDEA
jgi:orotidine-5'-phosphate decarboxylase